MDHEEISGRLEELSIGDIVEITWDRNGNGELSENYVYFGKNSESKYPDLRRYQEGKFIDDYSHTPSFDIFNPEITVLDISRREH